MRGLAQLIGIAAVAGAVMVHHRVQQVRGADANATESRLVYLPDAEFVGALSLGYREALADLVFIRGNIATASLKKRSEHAWVRRFYDVGRHLDPHFRGIYRWAAVTSIYSGLKDIRKSDVQFSRGVYTDALEMFPTDHEMLWFGGMVELGEVNRSVGFTQEEIDDAAAIGAARIRRAAAFGANPLVRRLAVTLSGDGQGAQALEQAFLRSQILTSTNPEHLRLAKARLKKISDARTVRGLDRMRLDFIRRQEAQFPYLPAPVFMLLEVE